MKHRLIALLLTLALTASLAGCTGGDTPESTVDPTPDATEATTLAPDAIPDPDPGVTSIPDKGTPPPEYTHHPDDHGGDDPAHHTPEVTHHPDDDHQAPAADPTPTPTPEPTEEAALTPQLLYVWWCGLSSQYPGPGANLSDMSSVMENYYDLSAGDLEDYVLYMPAMSSSMEEVFIAKAKPGKVSAVKSACESRLEDLKEDADLYPATAGNLDTAKIETIGDWVVLAVCATPGNLVKIVKDAVK